MKLIATDYDGTLNYNGVGTETIEAIRKWRQAGNAFGVVSGRGPDFIPELMNILGSVVYQRVVRNIIDDCLEEDSVKNVLYEEIKQITNWDFNSVLRLYAYALGSFNHTKSILTMNNTFLTKRHRKTGLSTSTDQKVGGSNPLAHAKKALQNLECFFYEKYLILSLVCDIVTIL